MNHQHWLHTRLEEAAKDPETVHNKRWMHISVQKNDKAVYAAHHQFISFIQNVSISLVNMQITEINRCDCVYCLFCEGLVLC